MSLILCIEANDLHRLNQLIAEGANVDVDAVDGSLAPPLIQAAYKGRVECGKALIYAKANVNKIHDNNLTAIHIASLKGDVEFVKLLVQHKAHLNVLNVHGQLPLHYASSYGYLACVKVLVAGGSQLEILNMHDRTPLAIAICNRQPKVAQFLLFSGAKMKNVCPRIQVPDWMKRIVTKRKRVIRSTLNLKGVLKKRFKVDGAEAAYLNGRIPKDMVNLIGYHVWSTCLDKEWE